MRRFNLTEKRLAVLQAVANNEVYKGTLGDAYYVDHHLPRPDRQIWDLRLEGYVRTGNRPAPMGFLYELTEAGQQALDEALRKAG